MTKGPANLTFYTEPSVTTPGWWVGRCRERPELSYERENRSTALSGIKRLAAKDGVAHTGPSHAPAPAVVQKPKLNRVAFVIDRSGSMNGLESAVLNAFRSNITTLIDQQAQTGQITTVTVVTFDSVSQVIRSNVPVHEMTSYVNELKHHEIEHRGMTAMMDAIDDAVKSLKANQAMDERMYDVSYLVITLTDGDENASKRFFGLGGHRAYGGADFKQFIRTHQATDVWTFAFQVPPGAARKVCNDFGAMPGNVTEWEGSIKGVSTASVQNNVGLSCYYAMRSAGAKSSKSFYTTNTQHLSTAAVVANLVDIRHQVREHVAKRTEDIRTLCEGAFRQFSIGAAFYQLAKPEKVQDYKQLLIVDRSSGAVYAGQAARQMLGVPQGMGEIRLQPGDHSNYDVYVQSTSVNRKIYPGTKVIYHAASAR